MDYQMENNKHGKHPYGAEVYSLLFKLRVAGFSPVFVDDGGEVVPADTTSAAIDAILSVDESTLAVEKDSCRQHIYIVLGNGPGEIVCNHTSNDELEKVCYDHYLRFGG